MKVLHLITGLGVGGAELQLRSVLQNSRHEGDVVTLYNPGTRRRDVEQYAARGAVAAAGTDP